MSRFRPSVAEERWLAVKGALPALTTARAIGARDGGWITSGVIKRCALFVLGLVGAVLVYALFELLQVPAGSWLAALLLIGAAEWLILHHRVFGCGIEEAFELAGILTLVFLFSTLPLGEISATVFLLAAAGLAVAGVRLLNPLFTTAALVTVSFAIDTAVGHAHTGVSLGSWPPAYYCFSSAAVGLALCATAFRRPAHAHLVTGLVVVMPVAGYAWLTSNEYRHSAWLTLVPLAVLGSGALFIAVRRRLHAPLVAALLCSGCLAFELHRFSVLALEWRLLGGGTAALVVGMLLDRHLREPRRGITSRDFETADANVPRDLLDVLPLAGAAALTPAEPSAGARYQGGGGGFSGGGASAEF